MKNIGQIVRGSMRAFCKLALGGFILFAAAAPGWANPILTLESSGAGVYNYTLTFQAGLLSFGPGQGITLTGLSGVTGASKASLLNAFLPTLIPSFTDTTAAFTTAPGNTLNANLPPGTFGTLVINSTVLTLGTINYSVTTAAGTFNGTAQGPVEAPVPEPSSIALLGAGILGLGAARRKLFIKA